MVNSDDDDDDDDDDDNDYHGLTTNLTTRFKASEAYRLRRNT
jgi:hypothetical protein